MTFNNNQTHNEVFKTFKKATGGCKETFLDVVDMFMMHSESDIKAKYICMYSLSILIYL